MGMRLSQKHGKFHTKKTKETKPTTKAMIFNLCFVVFVVAFV